LIKEKIKDRLNSGNACYHPVQNVLSSRLLSKNLKIRIYKIIILPVVLYWCKTSSLILREEHRLRVFQYRELKRIFGPKRNQMTGRWRELYNEEISGIYSSQSEMNLSSEGGKVTRECRTNGDEEERVEVIDRIPEG
jgi:hypothetical protein